MLEQADKAIPLIEDLKARSIHPSDLIQQNVMAFAEQVQFQFAYDPWHNITAEVKNAADNLLADLEDPTPTSAKRSNRSLKEELSIEL